MITNESHLLLIRSPILPLNQDQYENYYTNPSIFLSLNHLPVLSTSFSSPAELTRIIESGPKDKYSGVIITSGRSIEAWSIAANSTSSISSNSDWSQTPFFVVGHGTRDGLLRMNSPPSQLIHGADDSGSGERLGNYIINYFESRSNSPPSLPLLALVGDKNRDTIPRMMAEKKIGLHKLRVYETNPQGEFQLRLKELLNSIEGTGKIVWIVLFSPSGAKHCLNVMLELGIPLEKMSSSISNSLESNPSNVGGGGGRFKLAAIGPTTKLHVEEEEGFKIHAMAESPDAVDLLKALQDCQL